MVYGLMAVASFIWAIVVTVDGDFQASGYAWRWDFWVWRGYTMYPLITWFFKGIQMVSFPVAYTGVAGAWWYYIWTLVSIANDISFAVAPLVMWTISFAIPERPCGYSNTAV